MMQNNKSVEAELAENLLLLGKLFPGEALTSRIILDVGCGEGRWSLAFAERGAHQVVGLDLSFSALQSAVKTRTEQKRESVGFVRANIEQLPLPDETADLVFSWGCLHYAGNPEAGLRELLRVCAPAGQVVIQANAATAWAWIHRSLHAIVAGLSPGARERLLRWIVVLISGLGGGKWGDAGWVRQKLAWRWFFPGPFHFLDAERILEEARRLGWEGERVPLEHPSRYHPANSFLLRFRKNKNPAH